METEISEFPGYFATPDGQIVSYKTGKRHVLIGGSCNSGYRGVLLRKNGKTIRRNVHRLIAITFIDNPHNLPSVNHVDGNKKNNDVSNLQWCTASENMKHAFQTGLNTVSKDRLQRLHVAAGKAKALFTEVEACNIRAIYKYMDKPNCRKLAKAYKCSKAVIQRIVNGSQVVFKEEL